MIIYIPKDHDLSINVLIFDPLLKYSRLKRVCVCVCVDVPCVEANMLISP
jgi:hypothetical protein